MPSDAGNRVGRCVLDRAPSTYEARVTRVLGHVPPAAFRPHNLAQNPHALCEDPVTLCQRPKRQRTGSGVGRRGGRLGRPR